MTISFDSIPLTLVPGSYIEFSNRRAVRGTPAMPNKVLLLGQMLVGGTGAANTPFLIPSKDVAVQAAGRASMFAAMAKAYKAINPYTELWGIMLADNGAGVAATGSYKFTAVPTQSGTFQLYIAGSLVQIAAPTTSTLAQLATALIAAINANLDLPVTALVDGTDPTKVNITAVHKGLTGNDIDLRTLYYSTDTLPAGLTGTLVAMTGGTTAPSLTAAISAMGDDWYNHIILPYYDAASIGAMDVELMRRWGPTVMKEGHAYSAAAGTVGSLATLGNSYNSSQICILENTGKPTWPPITAAIVAAQAAYYSNIDPARPLQTLPLTGVMAAAPKDRLLWTDQQLLLSDGIATSQLDAGSNVLIQRMVSLYKTNAQGAVDPSYRDVEKKLTLSFIRYSMRTRIFLRFPRFKLASDTTIVTPGQAMARPKDIRNELIALAGEWMDAGLIENIDQFVRDLIVEIDPNDPDRANAIVPPNLVGQFRIFAAQIQFII